MNRRAIAFVALAVICSSGMAWAQPLTKAAVYSVKFLCGFQPPLDITPLGPTAEPGVKPGNYATAVNIHNFHQFSVTFCKKAVSAPPERCLEPGSESSTNCLIAVGKPQVFTLGANRAMELDCTDIVKLLQVPPPLVPSFIKGCVEIAVSPEPRLPDVNPLSVTGVYTALGCTLIPGKVACPNLIGTGLDVEPQNSFQGELPPECIF